MQCLRCKGGMESEMLGELRVDRCEACGGKWLDPGEFMRLWKIDPAIIADYESKAKAQGPPPLPSEQKERAVLCPMCSTVMPEVPFQFNRNIFIEQCEGCGGVFLDRGEAFAVREYLQNQTPDEAKRVAAEAGVAIMAEGALDRDEIDRLANPLRYSRSYRYRRADYGPSRSSGSFLDFLTNLHQFIAEGASGVMSRLVQEAEQEKMEAKRKKKPPL
ncbi:MAG: zf-TFIIB domain-containing protein [Armatimonadetes bacterium]|nr:zf-TFIIB domain-containing protein [Armatimonadota bacterium]